MSRKKVCFVLPSLAGGGAERVAVQILNALDPLAWDRSMYLFRREGPYLDDVDGSIALSSGAGGSRIGRWVALRRFLVETRPDVVVVVSELPLGVVGRLGGADRCARGVRLRGRPSRPSSPTATITGGGRGVAGCFRGRAALDTRRPTPSSPPRRAWRTISWSNSAWRPIASTSSPTPSISTRLPEPRMSQSTRRTKRR